MQAYSKPLIELQVAATRFVRDRSLRLLHVIADASVHEAVVEILAAQEYRTTNRSPFVILQEPHKRADPGWERRVITARGQHELRRTQMAEHGEALDELPAAPEPNGLVGLAEQLGQLLLVRPEGTVGLVVVLAPSYVEAPERWQQALGVLLSLKGLDAARFVIVDRERSSLGGLVSRHEARAMTVTCRVEGESPKAIVAGALDDEILGFDGPVGARPKGVIPPRRIHDPPARPPEPAALQQLEVSRTALLASVAIEEGRMPDAVAHQRRARDVSMEAGRVEQAVMMELVLGGYLLTADAVAQAEESYLRASATAEAAALPDKAAMARLALGSSRLVRGDRTGALVEFARAATLAEQGGHDALALHACRLTGDVARELRMDAQAIAFWAKAIEIAERDPATAPLTSAGLVALQLAVLCRERGQHAEAEAFLNKADALIRLEPERLQREPEVEPTGDAPPADETPPVDPVLPVDEPPRATEATPHAMPSGAAATRPAIEYTEGPPAETAFENVPLRAPMPPPEGTARLTWADIAAFHGESPSVVESSGTEHIHRWSSIEQDALRSTTSEIIGHETTALLSQDELAALRGEVDLPPARIEQTERLDPAALAHLRGEPAAEAPARSSSEAPAISTAPATADPVVPAALGRVLPPIPGQGTELYTKEMIRALRTAWAKRTGDDPKPGGEER